MLPHSSIENLSKCESTSFNPIHQYNKNGQHLNKKVIHSPAQKRLPEQVSNIPPDQRSTSFSKVQLKPESNNYLALSTDRYAEQQSQSPGEFYFTNDPLSKQQIIDKLTHEQAATFCIRSLEDLEKHGLIQQVWLERGQLLKEEGRLFINQPLTLVFDLTAMAPGDISSFNDILQVGPTFNAKPLGDHIRRVFLVNDRMLKESHASNPDLWRRLGRMEQKTISEADYIVDSVTDEALIAQKTTEGIPDNKQVTIIDFAIVSDWYHCLFGGITPNEQGQFIFSEGELANLSDENHLVFKNAPWDSAGFKETLATAIRKGGFEANRRWINLPEQMTLSREQISETQLNILKSQIIRACEIFSPKSPFVCINSISIESLKSHSRIENASAVRTDMLTNLLEGNRQLVITGDLNKTQWLWLLTKINLLSEHQKPSVFTNLPISLLLSSGSTHWQMEEADFLQSLNASSATSVTYEVNPTDTLDSLQQVNLISQNNFTFSLTDSSLIQAVLNGTPVILSGLERNPKLAASLETLLLPTPYLFIHGHKVYLPETKVTWIRPTQGQTTGSSLIDQIFSRLESHRQPRENPIYSLLKTLPQSYRKTYPSVPPWSAIDFQRCFDQEADRERQLDGSSRLMPCHQRRALHILLAKAYRGDTEVYSFIKAKIALHYPNRPADNRADLSALQQWLEYHPAPELKDIKTDFWILARYCPAEVHQSISRFDCKDIDENTVLKLASYVVGAACQSPQMESSLAQRLKVNLNAARKQSFFDGKMRSTLSDFLIACKSSLKQGMVISKTIISLEEQIVPVLMSDQTMQKKSRLIKEKLIPCFQGKQLPRDCEDLPTVLLANQRHTQSRQERRLAHLTSRIQRYPLVFLQGEAGAGKTFMAQAIAARAGYTDCQVIQVSPNLTSEELFGGPQLINGITDDKEDSYTAFREGPLLQWALSMCPPLLVLDEANLAPDGLLAPLAGLTREPRAIHYQGKEYPLIEKHRIILTGNPDHYEGRRLDTTLKSRVPTFFYRPLPETMLAKYIILPSLPAEWPDAQKQQACDRLLTLFNHFKSLVPGDLITPRDIKDVLATVRQIIRHYPAAGAHPVLCDITEEQVNTLILRAFMESLAGAVTAEYQQRLTSLNLWYQGRYQEDLSIMKGADQSFATFLQQLQADNTSADFSPEPVRQLIHHYWQNLDKDEQGRTGILVEGPAGWGKDFILVKTVRQWQKQQVQQQQSVTPFTHINANLSQWSTLVNEVKQAMSKGQLIAISELNLIPSSYLEGLFNDILTGHAVSGFRLFATMNPRAYTGREAMSPALKSRCTQVRLGALSQQELEGLVKRLPGMPDGLPQWLSDHFYQLSMALNDQNSPVQLALDDLFCIANHMASQRPDQWHIAFQQHLSLPFQSLAGTLPDLQDTRAILERVHSEEKRRLDVERIANSVPGLLAPLTVKFGKILRCGDGEITVTRDISEDAVIRIIQSTLQKSWVYRNKSGNDEQTATPVASTTIKPSSSATLFSFGDILTPQHFQVTRYFPEHPYDHHHYRLRLQETYLDEDGQICNYSIDWQNDPPVPVAEWPDDTIWRTDLREDELPGQIQLILNNQWQPLPALTPFDQLRAIRCIPETEIELARSEKTGQLLIRELPRNDSPLSERAQQKNTLDLTSTTARNKGKKTFLMRFTRKKGSSSGVTPKPALLETLVTVDFIIAPEQTYFTQLKPGDSLILQNNLCSDRLIKLLEKNIFYQKKTSCKAYEELRSINKINGIPERISALMTWLDSFSENKNITGQGQHLLLNMLRKKRGVCRHKAMIFQMLCHYWGVPTRQVINTSHAFVEISPDDGQTWRQYQLGGGGQASTNISEPTWSNYRQPDNSVLRPPVERFHHSQHFNFSLDYNSRVYIKLNEKFKELKEHLVQGSINSKVLLEKLKSDYSLFLNMPAVDSKKSIDIPHHWGILLSPQALDLFGEEIKEWERIIESSSWNMEKTRCNSFDYFMFCFQEDLIDMIKEKEIGMHYFNWICDIYDTVPLYLKY